MGRVQDHGRDSRVQMSQDIAVREYPQITLEMLKEYATVSGDHNPIHQDEKVAREMGLPGIIAHGMLSAAWLVDRGYRHVAASGQKRHLISSQFKFRAMALLGDALSIGGSAREEGSTWILELQAKNPRGETVTSALLKFNP